MATQTTPTSAAAWRPDVAAIAPTDAIPDALVLMTSTVAGRVEGDEPAVRCQYVDDDEAAVVAEGDPIDEADPSLAEVVVNTLKVAQLIRLSEEQWSQPNASTLLSESVRRAVTRKANLAYLTQPAPTAPAVTPPAGIYTQAALDAGTVEDSLDTLVDLQAAISAQDGIPSHLLLSPTAWASLRKLKDEANSARSLLGAGTDDAEQRLLNLPVIVTNALPGDAGMMIDSTAIVSAVGDVRVAQSEHAYFASDSIGLRCTWRFGARLVHPERVGKFTVASAEAETAGG